MLQKYKEFKNLNLYSQFKKEEDNMDMDIWQDSFVLSLMIQ